MPPPSGTSAGVSGVALGPPVSWAGASQPGGGGGPRRRGGDHRPPGEGCWDRLLPPPPRMPPGPLHRGPQLSQAGLPWEFPKKGVGFSVLGEGDGGGGQAVGLGGSQFSSCALLYPSLWPTCALLRPPAPAPGGAPLCSGGNP